MAIDRIIQLKLLADVSNIDKQLAGTQSKLGRLGASFKGFAGAVALDAAITGVGLVTDGITKGVEEWKLYNQQVDTLDAKLKGLDVDIDTADLTAAIDSLSFENAFDDADSLEAFNTLLQRTGDVDEAMKGLTLSMDLARAKNIDLGAAAGEVGNIYKGEAEKMAEYGVTADEAVKNSATNWDLALSDIEGRAETFNSSLDGKMQKANEFIERGFSALAGIGLDWLEDAIPVIEEQFLPALQDIATKAAPVVEKFGEFVGKAIELGSIITEKLEPVLTPLIDITFNNLGTVLDTITGLFDVLIDLLNGDFTAAWEGIKKTVATVMAGIERTVKSALNVIIDLWNRLDWSIDFDFDGPGIPNPLGGWLVEPIRISIHTGDLIPDIPRLAQGGIVTSPTIAMVGEGRYDEAIIPLDGRSLGGTVVININGDPAVIEASVMSALRRTGMNNGTLQVTDRLRSPRVR